VNCSTSCASGTARPRGTARSALVLCDSEGKSRRGDLDRRMTASPQEGSATARSSAPELRENAPAQFPATVTGEFFIRYGAALRNRRTAAPRPSTLRSAAPVASRRSRRFRLLGWGIAVDRRVPASALFFSTAGMYRGYARTAALCSRQSTTSPTRSISSINPPAIGYREIVRIRS